MQEKVNMICIKCKNVIDPNCEYSKTEDYNNGKYIKTWFIHKTCFFEIIKISQGFSGVMNNLNKITENLLQ